MIYIETINTKSMSLNGIMTLCKHRLACVYMGLTHWRTAITIFLLSLVPHFHSPHYLVAKSYQTLKTEWGSLTLTLQGSHIKDEDPKDCLLTLTTVSDQIRGGKKFVNVAIR